VTLLVASLIPTRADTFVYVAVAVEERIAVYRLDPDTGKRTNKGNGFRAQSVARAILSR
jgi:hypothetical protein